MDRAHRTVVRKQKHTAGRKKLADPAQKPRGAAFQAGGGMAMRTPTPTAESLPPLTYARVNLLAFDRAFRRWIHQEGQRIMQQVREY